MLTSLPGAAITNVKVDGVLHEFSTISGVKEDMADIIQNLKSVRFKLSDSDVDNVKLTLKGKKVFTAADIQKATDQFEVLNQDQYITEINSNGKMEIELRIGVGKGYIPSEENELPNAPIGTLAMDSIFNPVTKVTYNIQPVPGAKDPIEILSMEIETERPITVQEGTNKVIGTDKENIINEINNVLGSKISNEAKIKYWDGETADRIFQILFR